MSTPATVLPGMSEDKSADESRSLMDGVQSSTGDFIEYDDGFVVHSTSIPSRLDKLPFSSWHLRMVMALGVTWILDGMEVSLLSIASGVLQEAGTLNLSEVQIGFSGSAYLTGAVIGAIVFGYLADRFGRKKLFLLTLIIYVISVTLTTLSWNFPSFLIFRFMTGLGVGGEYTAIFAAIDEMIPAPVRGFVDLMIDGSWWIGSCAAAVLSLYFLNPEFVSVDSGWRFLFAIGALAALPAIFSRNFIPESPRWLLTHGYIHEAEETVRNIEEAVIKEMSSEQKRVYNEAKQSHSVSRVLIARAQMNQSAIYHRDMLSHRRVARTYAGTLGYIDVVKILLRTYPTRFLLASTLMMAQAFFYNGIFYTYGLILKRFYGLGEDKVGLMIIPFAIGNFLGPVVFGRFFDTVGRRKMIVSTYAGSAVLLATTSILFQFDCLSVATQTLAWSLVFFVASSGASSAHLTVSEIFPVEIRAQSMAVFFTIGLGIGGIVAPSFFSFLVSLEARIYVCIGYYIGAFFMLVAAFVAFHYAVDAEGKTLEDVAAPLSFASDDHMKLRVQLPQTSHRSV
eukprot:GILJ01012860.1.p1 GENE.GILJ01012860.1~~GILJ01012860.1.p1  ORF type:complete len:565 (+),score=63.27 GILJ01012860.1:78-1772(+)